MKLLKKISNRINWYMKYPLLLYYHVKYHFIYPFYHSCIIPSKVQNLRNKDVIEVLFIVDELGSWKTEKLYLKMLQHSRFNVQLLLVPEINSPYEYQILKKYLDKKCYNYKTLSNENDFRKLYHPDIIFYQKPFEPIISPKYFFYYNLDVLFCYVNYCFRDRTSKETRKNKFLPYVWQLYAENNVVIKEYSSLLRTRAKNMINTGLPVMDDLLEDKSKYVDPWKLVPGKRKRIIFAPHHTIFSGRYTFSMFLQYCEFMLEMAKKYNRNTLWAFKPHPILKRNLYKVWGVDKTDAYYRQWESLENCQLCEGEYIGLFKYSDAMIHDSRSFMIEYLYTGNPVMYLIKPNQKNIDGNWQINEALKMHYHAESKEDIEKFIIDVINENDKLKEKRRMLVDNILTPPNGKSACANIINAILGTEEYIN